MTQKEKTSGLRSKVTSVGSVCKARGAGENVNNHHQKIFTSHIERKKLFKKDEAYMKIRGKKDCEKRE